MALNQFVNSGTDEATVQDMKKSIAREEDLQKAMNKAGLVQKEVQVKGKNGQTFTRKQWVKASEDSTQPQSTSATEKPASKGKDDVMQKWKDKVDAGNFTDDVKKELKYGIDTKAAALVEKDGKYKTAKTWDEADYANQQGWKTVDSITSIINNGKLPDNKSSQPANQSDTNSIEFKLDKTKSGKVGAVWSIESNGKKESATVVNKIPDGYRKHTDITVEGRNFTIYTNGNDLLATEKNNTDNKADSQQAVTKEDSSKSFITPRSKSLLTSLLQQGVSREDIMAQAEKDGVTWNKHSHPGINWMRASMAMTGTSTKGNKKADAISLKKGKLRNLQ